MARLLAGMERLEAGQTELRRDLAQHGAKLDRILQIVQGQATHRVATDNRLSALERAAG